MVPARELRYSWRESYINGEDGIAVEEERRRVRLLNRAIASRSCPGR